MENKPNTFYLGSEWIYVKIYTNINSANQLLNNEVFYLINYLKNERMLKEWFFIRYRDPEYHIRLRIKPISNMMIGPTLVKIYSCLEKKIKNKTITDLVYSGYVQEIERYGGDELMRYAESIFAVDSYFILKILRYTKKNQSENIWKIALILIDDFFRIFNIDVKRQLNIIRVIDNSYQKEFGLNAKTSATLNNFYRQKKNIISGVFSREIQVDGLSRLYKITQDRRKAMSPIALSILTVLSDHKKEKMIDILIHSYIHMSMIRLFDNKPRYREAVVYNFTRKYYETKYHTQNLQK